MTTTKFDPETVVSEAHLEGLRELRRKWEAKLRVIAGPCVTPIMNGDVARVVELPAGGLRIEWWVKGAGWVTAPDGGFDLADFIPGDTNRPVLEKDAIRLGCRLADFGPHWTEMPATPRDRAKIVGLIKTRAWDLACRRVPPGHA